MTTPATRGKVKRLRNTSCVEMRACDRMGSVREGAALVTGSPEIESGVGANAKTHSPLVTGSFRSSREGYREEGARRMCPAVGEKRAFCPLEEGA